MATTVAIASSGHIPKAAYAFEVFRRLFAACLMNYINLRAEKAFALDACICFDRIKLKMQMRMEEVSI